MEQYPLLFKRQVDGKVDEFVVIPFPCFNLRVKLMFEYRNSIAEILLSAHKPIEIRKEISSLAGTTP